MKPYIEGNEELTMINRRCRNESVRNWMVLRKLDLGV